jgi:hypothetical protein
MAEGKEEKPVVVNEAPSLSSYLLRFRKLCEGEAGLKNEVLDCRLHLTLDGFRGILWARWLGILSQSMKDWPEDVAKSRARYNNVKAKYLKDQRADPSLHPSINNPLSQDTKSPWNQFFVDTELKKDIERVS